MPELKKEQLEYLIELQKIETDATKYTASLEGVQEKIALKEQELDAREKEFQIEESSYLEYVKTLKTLETEVEDISARILKSRETIKKVSNNKEYQVLQRELDDNAKRKSEMEEKIIELISLTEEEEGKNASKKAELDQLREKIGEEIEVIRGSNKDDIIALESLDKKRNELFSKIDTFLLERFNRILKTSDGIAIVRVFNETCGGCFLSIPPQLFIEMKKNDELHFCPQCHRMVYYEEK
jgi:hypothetical protein